MGICTVGAYSSRGLVANGLYSLRATASGPMAASLSELLYFGNVSMYASSIDSPPLLLTLACMVVTEAAVLIPVATLAERYGAKAYRQEVAAFKEEHPG